MHRNFCSHFVVYPILAAAMAWLFAIPVYAQVNGARPVITERIDEGKLQRLPGNTRPETTRSTDRGELPNNFAMDHLQLQLRRSPEQDQALQQYLDDLQNPNSANYHQWLNAQEYGQRFGLAQQDLDTITSWLGSHGLTVNFIYTSRMVVDFSGTAGQVREAFRTEMHALDVNGVSHVANISDPQIPAALAPAVVGVVSLHDFTPRPLYRSKPNYTFTSSGATYQAVVPGDVATIYNLNPLFSSGISGQGQTVVVIEDTNVFSTSDWTTFRSTFGLSGYTAGSFTQVHPAPPSGTNNCINPGANGNDIEAILDAEYASAAAPSAKIELASCADTLTFGGLIALQNLLNASGTPPSIVSISYGECEAANGASANASYNSAYQQAVAEGVSVFVSSGDEGAASCDANLANATHGIGVSGFTSTPNNVSVGGTDYGDTFAGTNSTYWNSTNTSTFGSAKSYVPEIPWNDSCASLLLANYLSYSATYGSSGFCNSSTANTYGMHTTASGSGGPSGCASGTPTISEVVSGSCAGYAKPSWQSIVGNPADGVRDIPDVSLFAANGVWGHYYVFCDSDTAHGGTACTGAPNAWSGAGGTSFASPIWAGFQALINQKVGGSQGNPNPTYYSLASGEYGPGGSSTCNSKLGNGVASSCIFYDVTQGDIDVNCTGTHSCYDPSGTYGVLSTTNSSYAPGYGTSTGWDFATGIGTVNVANLVNSWPVSTTSNFSLSPSPSSVTVTQGAAGGTSTITINPTNNFTGSVTLSASGLPSGVTAAFGTNPATSTSLLTLTASSTATTGTASVTITGISGSLTQTTSVSLTVNAPVTPNFSLSTSPASVTITQGGTGGTSTVTVNPVNSFSGSVSLSASGLPSGVTASFGTNPTTGSSLLTLTTSSTATTGTVTVTITGVSGGLTHTTTLSLKVNAAASPNFSLSALPTSLSVTRGTHGTSTITVNKTNGFSGNVTLSATGMGSGVTASFGTNPATSTSVLTLAASSGARTGFFTITIHGVSGTLTHTTSISLRIR